MCARRHWLYSRLTFCTSDDSQLIKIAEFLIKTERKIYKKTQNILLNGCYLLFEEYLQENTSFYILKPGREIGQSFKKNVLPGGKLLIKNKHFAWIIKQLLNMAFWRTSIGSIKVSSPLICLNGTKFVFLSVFTLIETTCPKIWAKLLHTNAQLSHLYLSSIITQNACILRLTVSL